MKIYFLVIKGKRFIFYRQGGCFPSSISYKERTQIKEPACEPTSEYEMLTVTQYGGFFFLESYKCIDFRRTQKKNNKNN